MPNGPFGWEDEAPDIRALAGAVVVGCAKGTIASQLHGAVGVWLPDIYSEEQVKGALVYLPGVATVHRVGFSPLGSSGSSRDLSSPIPGFIYRCRLDRDWTMEWVSQGVEEVTGYQGHELTRVNGISYSGLIHTADRSLVDEAVRQGVALNRPFTMRYRVRFKDGSTRWVREVGQGVMDSHGALIGLLGHIMLDSGPQDTALDSTGGIAALVYNILVVDDERSIVSVLSKFLERAGHRVLRAGSRAEALEAVGGWEHVVDVLLTDVVLANGSGCDLARDLSSRFPHVKVIYMSGYAADQRVLEEVNSGRALFIAKPFLPSTAVAKIREVME